MIKIAEVDQMQPILMRKHIDVGHSTHNSPLEDLQGRPEGADGNESKTETPIPKPGQIYI